MARLAPTYLPRKPHETVLYHLVKEHGDEFLQYARDAYDGPLPGFVHLQCTVLSTRSPGSPYHVAIAASEAR